MVECVLGEVDRTEALTVRIRKTSLAQLYYRKHLCAKERETTLARIKGRIKARLGSAWHTMLYHAAAITTATDVFLHASARAAPTQIKPCSCSLCPQCARG